MNKLLRNFLSQSSIEKLGGYRDAVEWARRGFSDNSPQYVKQKVFLRYGIPGAPWVETGTFRGTTTQFLSKRFPKVYSIEPSPELFKDAQKRFQGAPVELFNGTSEDVLSGILSKLSGPVNFWLDGHYSAGVTFKGATDCPITDELNAVAENLPRFGQVAVLIDDVRCFLGVEEKYKDYPSIDYLVDWSRTHDLRWRIECDIFIAKSK